MTPAKVRSTWEELPAAWRTGMKIGAMVAGALVFLGTGARLDTVLGEDLAPRVMAVEASIDTLRYDAERDRAEVARDRAYFYTELEFISCERKAANGMDGKTLDGCIEDYRRRVRDRP